MCEKTVDSYRPDFPALIAKYPFIRVVDWKNTKDWSKPVFSDTLSCLDCIPNGWQQPWFLETMLECLDAAIKSDGMDPEKIYMTDAKEKYGTLRMDFSTPWVDGKAFSDTCYLFEELAGYFCCKCGKPHVAITRGWICPFCRDCWDDINGPFIEAELQNPSITCYDKDHNPNTRVIDLKPFYDRIVERWKTSCKEELKNEETT